MFWSCSSESFWEIVRSRNFFLGADLDESVRDVDDTRRVGVELGVCGEFVWNDEEAIDDEDDEEEDGDEDEDCCWCSLGSIREKSFG